MIRAVIFDFNGVLLDDEQVHCDLFREVLAEEGISFTDDDYRDRYLGLDDKGCFEAALMDAGRPAPRELVDAMVGRKAGRYAEAAGRDARDFPGASATLAAMADAWPVAINSGALRPEIEWDLDRRGLRNRVSAIVSAEVVERCKPDPEGYLMALDALRSAVGLDIEAAHCLVIEDSMAGIQSAKSAGMWAVGITNTYEAADLRSAGADAVIETLEGFGPAWVREFFTPEVSP